MNVRLYSALSLASMVMVLDYIWDCDRDGVRGERRLYFVCVFGAFLFAVLLHFGILALAADLFFDVREILLEFHIAVLRPAFQAPLLHEGAALWARRLISTIGPLREKKGRTRK